MPSIGFFANYEIIDGYLYPFLGKDKCCAQRFEQAASINAVTLNCVYVRKT